MKISRGPTNSGSFLVGQGSIVWYIIAWYGILLFGIV